MLNYLMQFFINQLSPVIFAAKRQRPVVSPRLRKLLVQLTAGLGQVLTGLPRSGPKLPEFYDILIWVIWDKDYKDML
jgi:hypothetical protein